MRTLCRSVVLSCQLFFMSDCRSSHGKSIHWRLDLVLGLLRGLQVPRSFFPVRINFRGLTFLLGVTRNCFSITFHGIAAVKFILTGNYSSECDHLETLICVCLSWRLCQLLPGSLSFGLVCLSSSIWLHKFSSQSFLDMNLELLSSVTDWIRSRFTRGVIDSF